MKTLYAHHSGGCRTRFTIGVLAAVGVVTLWSASLLPSAQAKGPVKFELCGELGCVEKNSMRFTAAMLYGGRLNDGPGCASRVHTLIGDFPGDGRNRRYLVVASKGLIGEQGKGGYVWWRKVGGSKKGVLAKAVSRTGTGFAAEPETDSSILSGGPDVKRWRLRGDRISCAPNGLAGQARDSYAFLIFDVL